MILEALKGQGNLLDALLGIDKENNTIKVIRVYPYESHVGNVFANERREYIEKRNKPEEMNVLTILDQIRQKVSELNWNDNKIVVELNVGFHHVFVGFWDLEINFGLSVIPNEKWPAQCKISSSGKIEPVIVERP